MPTDLERSVARAVARVPAVRVAYLFGSRARGDARDDSDLDVAVALRRDLSARDRGAAILDVIAALTDELGPIGERADVVDLARADGGLALHAVRDGRRVLARDDEERIAVEVLAARRCDDERPWRELFERAAIDAWRKAESPR